MSAPSAPGDAALASELASLADFDIASLRRRWRDRFRSSPPAHRSPSLLIRAYAYQLQAQRAGGLPRDLKRKLDQLSDRFAADRNYRPEGAPALQTGSVIVKEWNGRRYLISVVTGGFQLEEKTYTSLSAVAHAITGVKWSGPRFFRETGGAK